MTVALSRVLGDPTTGGLFRCAYPDALASAAGRAGVEAIRVALDAKAGKAGVLDALARALAFPQWFGANWDALEDCLTDLSWRLPGPLLLLFTGCEAFRMAHPLDFDMLVDVLASSAAHWADEGAAFIVALDGALSTDAPEIVSG